jgi:hypothetical protein
LIKHVQQDAEPQNKNYCNNFEDIHTCTVLCMGSLSVNPALIEPTGGSSLSRLSGRTISRYIQDHHTLHPLRRVLHPLMYEAISVTDILTIFFYQLCLNMTISSAVWTKESNISATHLKRRHSLQQSVSWCDYEQSWQWKWTSR